MVLAERAVVIGIIRHGWPRSLHAIIDRHDVDVDDVDVYPIRQET